VRVKIRRGYKDTWGVEGFLRLRKNTVDPEHQDWLLENDIQGAHPYEDHRAVENTAHVEDVIPATWDQVEKVDNFGLFNDMITAHVHKKNDGEHMAVIGNKTRDLNWHALDKAGYLDSLLIAGGSTRDVYRHMLEAHNNKGVDPIIEQIHQAKDTKKAAAVAKLDASDPTNLDGETIVEDSLTDKAGKAFHSLIPAWFWKTKNETSPKDTDEDTLRS
jgi:hypothetical protein